MVSIMAVPGLAKNTDNAFRWALIQLAEKQGLNADYLAAVMSLETGTTFRPDIINKVSGALGLIQWLPSHFKSPNGMLHDLATYDEAKAMTQIEQLALVERYFQRVAPYGLESLCSHYLAVWSSYWLGKAESTVVARKDSTEPYTPGSNLTQGKVYEQNSGFDKSGKGFYTIADICATINGFRSANRIEVTEVGLPPPPKVPDPDSLLSQEQWLSLLALSLLEDADKRRYCLLPPKTENTIRRFQRANGLKVDGVPGPITLGKLVK